MELTKEESYAIQGIVYEYSSMYGGKIALGQFMEAIEKYPELPLKDIYDLLEPRDEDEEDEEED